MTTHIVDPSANPDADKAALERVERLFAEFDRLTPDELGRIGLLAADEDERERLLEAVDEAAARTGRTALVDQVRLLARETVLRRYATGTLHQTWIALNWGVSQGTIEDRVAIVEALTDAAAAAVVEDALDPEIAAALALDAQHVLGLAAGSASDGSLARVIQRPDDPELGPSKTGQWARIALVVLVVSGTIVGLGVGLGVPEIVAGAVIVGMVVVTVNRPADRRRGR
jgi:hypothetical protein